MSTDKRLVIVEWIDAGCDSSWQNEGTVLTCPKVWTSGWLLHQDEETVMIGATVCANGDFNQTMTIPSGMVKQILDLQSPVNPDGLKIIALSLAS